jgi:hypothetical protein
MGRCLAHKSGDPVRQQVGITHVGEAKRRSKLKCQCMKNHTRMMIGMGTPTIQRIKLRPMIQSPYYLSVSGDDCPTRREVKRSNF